MATIAAYADSILWGDKIIQLASRLAVACIDSPSPILRFNNQKKRKVTIGSNVILLRY